MLMGLGDWATALALYCSVGVTVFGVIYGVFHWNSSGETEKVSGVAGKHHRRRKRHKRRQVK